MYALPVWDRDEEKVILNLNSNPDGRRLDQKLAGHREETVRNQSLLPPPVSSSKDGAMHPPKAGLLCNFPWWVLRS